MELEKKLLEILKLYGHKSMVLYMSEADQEKFYTDIDEKLITKLKHDEEIQLPFSKDEPISLQRNKETQKKKENKK